MSASYPYPWSGRVRMPRHATCFTGFRPYRPADADLFRPHFLYFSLECAARDVNMDVPIALAITLAFGMSVYETMNHGQHAYFDASVTLLFFLLIGRTLDYDACPCPFRRARTGAAQQPRRGGDQRERTQLPIPAKSAGMRIILAAGEARTIDAAKVEEGRSELVRHCIG